MYLINSEEFDRIVAARGPGPSFDYASMYSEIYQVIQNKDDFGAEVQGAVLAWFGAAASANAGVGGPATFIRTYTEAQLEIRQGGDINNVDR